MIGEEWRIKAACRGLPFEIFFPEFGSDLFDPYADARSICAICPVTEQCLKVSESFASSGDRNGMFGGLSPAERKKIRKESNGVVC
jgi:hypothetical protein